MNADSQTQIPNMLLPAVVILFMAIMLLGTTWLTFQIEIIEAERLGLQKELQKLQKENINLWKLVEKSQTQSKNTDYFVKEMEVTAYTAGPESTGKYPGNPLYGITASGEKVSRGMAAASRSIPFGTRVYVPGYGHAIVQDRGSAITDGKLDVYIEDLQEARNWGRQHLEVKIFRGDYECPVPES